MALTGVQFAKITTLPENNSPSVQFLDTPPPEFSAIAVTLHNSPTAPYISIMWLSILMVLRIEAILQGSDGTICQGC
jgi:hypothetical protein